MDRYILRKDYTKKESKPWNAIMSDVIDYSRFFNDPISSDIIVKTDNYKFYCHKIILGSRSGYFYSRLYSDDFLTDVNIFKLDVDDDSYVPKFLEFLYNNKIIFTKENITSYFYLADRYNVKSLKKLIINFVYCNYIYLSLSELTFFLSKFSRESMCNNSNSLLTADKLAKHLGLIFNELVESNYWETLSEEAINLIISQDDLIVESEYKLWLDVRKWLLENDNLPCAFRTVGYIRFNFLSSTEYHWVVNDNIFQVVSSNLSLRPRLTCNNVSRFYCFNEKSYGTPQEFSKLFVRLTGFFAFQYEIWMNENIYNYFMNEIYKMGKSDKIMDVLIYYDNIFKSLLFRSCADFIKLYSKRIKKNDLLKKNDFF